jgi:hypothetical protein
MASRCAESGGVLEERGRGASTSVSRLSVAERLAFVGTIKNFAVNRARSPPVDILLVDRRERLIASLHGRNLVWRAGHIRTVPVPDCVRSALEEWLAAACTDRRKLFRRVNRVEKAWPLSVSERVATTQKLNDQADTNVFLLAGEIGHSYTSLTRKCPASRSHRS